MAKLDSAQLEQLQEIGAYLHKTRQAMAKPIEDVAAEIFIRASLIRAIEEGDGETLPEPIFVQGFIRRYAEALGLDGLALSKEFVVQPVSMFPVSPSKQPNRASKAIPTPAVTAHSPASASHSPAPASHSPASASHSPAPIESSPAPIESSPASVLPQDAAPAAPSQRSWMPIAVVGALALVVGGIIAITQTMEPSPSTATDQAETDTAATSEAASPTTQASSGAPESNSPSNSPSNSSGATATTADGSPAVPDAPVVVTVNLSGDAWMQVIADGSPVYEGTLSQGSAETWTAEQEIQITTGNAGAVSLSYNGSEANLVGDLGDVETLIFTASN